MTNHERVMALWNQGLTTEGLGPQEEWDPQPKDKAQRRHAKFWSWVTSFLEQQDGDYEELPGWMTEDAANQLELNGLDN